MTPEELPRLIKKHVRRVPVEGCSTCGWFKDGSCLGGRPTCIENDYVSYKG